MIPGSRTLLGRVICLVVILALITIGMITMNSFSGEDWYKMSQTVKEGAIGAATSISKGSESFNYIHIALNGDAAYSLGMFGVMNSTYATAAVPESLFFHIVTTDEENLKALTKKINIHLPFVKFQVTVFDATLMKDTKPIVWKDYRSSSLSKPIVYARFFFREMFPELDKLIYLDNDILVKKDITPLWNIDMGEYPIAAARLCRDSALFKNQFDYSSGKLDAFDGEECSLNNGVLVYNLRKWDGMDYDVKLREWTALNSQFRLWGLGSQPPFNLVFYRNYYILNDIWNLMDLSGLVNTKTKRPITRSLTMVAKAHVLHWNGVYKPWNGDGPYGELWRSFVKNPYEDKNYTKQYGQEEFLVTGSTLDPEIYQFTVVITSGIRVDTLKIITNQLRKLDNCKEILIVWTNLKQPCPEFTKTDHKIRCFPQNDDATQNRYLLWNHISTSAVLHHSDNSLLGLEDIELGFRTWLLNPDVPVGFEPRKIQCVKDPTHKKSFCSYSYQLTDASYHLVSGKHMFIHREYMKLYSTRPAIVEYNKKLGCEDIAMNFLAGALSRLPSIWVRPSSLRLLRSTAEIEYERTPGNVPDPRKDILGWVKSRRHCLVHFLNLFEGNPMPEQTHYAYDYDAVENSIWFRNIEKSRKEASIKDTQPATLSLCYDFSGITTCKLS